MSSQTVDISVHGVGLRLACLDPRVTEAFEHDFAYFLAARSEDPAPIKMVIKVCPLGERPSGWKPLFSGPRSTIFRSPGSERRVCFFGQAWTRYRFNEGQCEIYCDDFEMSYEVLYLAVLSFLGESLDRKGIHRIHGLGLVFGGDGMILMAASGTGKSTLGMNLLFGEGPGILSDDTPAVTWPATAVAFPLRVALEKLPPVDPKFVRKFRRFKHGEKYVVGADYFADRIRPSAPLRWLVEIKRDRSPRPHFSRVNRLRAVWPVFKWLVMGHETPQVWELFVRYSIADIVAKAAIFVRRLIVGIGMVLRTEFLWFHLSEDPKECAEALRNFKEVHQ